jgi:hypothetical protein
VIAIIGFLSLGQNNRISRSARSKFRTDDNYFKKIREKEKPFERISWAIIFAGISIASIGYFLIKNIY